MVFIDPGTDDNLNEHLCFLFSLRELFLHLTYIINAMPDIVNMFFYFF